MAEFAWNADAVTLIASVTGFVGAAVIAVISRRKVLFGRSL
jgi:hypothetical protein